MQNKTASDLLIFPTQRMELIDSQKNIKKLIKVAELYFLLLRWLKEDYDLMEEYVVN